mmetsp:Transcript_55132/g.146473  ORF Transcript_55132/g.146473 Transcript_55132/m.146473 type:complete len:205 (-) Transcript_55132:55-669(-)
MPFAALALAIALSLVALALGQATKSALAVTTVRVLALSAAVGAALTAVGLAPALRVRLGRRLAEALVAPPAVREGRLAAGLAPALAPRLALVLWRDRRRVCGASFHDLFGAEALLVLRDVELARRARVERPAAVHDVVHADEEGAAVHAGLLVLDLLTWLDPSVPALPRGHDTGELLCGEARLGEGVALRLLPLALAFVRHLHA